MTSLRRCAFALALLLCVSLVHAQEDVADVRTVNITFTTIDVPGASLTSVNGINTAGDMVGWYANSTSGPYHAFQLSGGNFTFFDYPGAVSTLATAINDSGLIAGFEGDLFDKGFVYDGVTFTLVRQGQSSRTIIYGMNNAGDLVGGSGTPSTTKAFALRNGQFQVINFPGYAVYAYATGINNLGRIVGWSDSGSGGQAYLYAQGKFKSVAVPGATQTLAWSINDDGVIVGYYGTGSPPFLVLR